MPLNIVKNADEFSPHIAVCSMTINDGAANKRNATVLRKSKSDKEIALLKMLKAEPSVLEKASVSNTKKLLEAALKDKFANAETYTWIYLEDFDPETNLAIFEMFEMDTKKYVIGYEVTSQGLIELSEEMEEVIKHNVYTTASENELILKGNIADEKQENSEIKSEANENEEVLSSDNPEEKQEEGIMSDPKDVQPVEFTKAQQDQISELLKAERLAVKQEIEAAELLKSTTESLSNLEGIVDAEDVEVLAKGLLKDTEFMSVVLKSFVAAKEAISAKDAEVAQIKKEFGEAEQTAEQAEPVITKGSTHDQLAAQMAKLKAKA